MEIYFVRHGTTSWNEEGRMQGRVDIPLSSKGKEDARNTRDLLKNIIFDKIVVSPLLRARQTAEIINEYHNVPMYEEPALIERDFGELEGVKKDTFNFKDLFSLKNPTIYDRAEPIEDFYKRVQGYINSLKGKEGTILIVAHGGVVVPVKLLVDNSISEDTATNELILKNGEVYYFCI